VANVAVKKKDGTTREFRHKGRPGGSYTVTVRYEGAFVIVTDEYGREVAIPAVDITEVTTEPFNGF